jgi:hypothetical protein
LFAGAAKPDSGGTQSVCGTATAYMAATDTLSIFLKISGSTKTVGVAGGTGAGNSGLSYLTVRLAG